MKENPEFSKLQVGQFVYLGSHPWNTGDVFGYGIVIAKGKYWWMFKGAGRGALKTGANYTVTGTGTYNVMKDDTRKIIRYA